MYENNIVHYFSTSDRKCAVVERFNLTIQQLLYKLMTNYNTYAWTNDDVYHIEKIIQTRGNGKNKQRLVKWEGWPSKFNSWVSDNELKNCSTLNFHIHNLHETFFRYKLYSLLYHISYSYIVKTI